MRKYWIKYEFGKQENSVSREIEADSYAHAMKVALKDKDDSRFIAIAGNEKSYLVNLDKVLYIEITESED